MLRKDRFVIRIEGCDNRTSRYVITFFDNNGRTVSNFGFLFGSRQIQRRTVQIGKSVHWALYNRTVCSGIQHIVAQNTYARFHRSGISCRKRVLFENFFKQKRTAASKQQIAVIKRDGRSQNILDDDGIFKGDMILFGCAARRTSDVEGTHRKLRTRLTDGLCGNDTDRFADFDNLIAGEVAAIALDTDAVFGLAG